MLKEGGVQVTIEELIGFYQEYADYRKKIQQSLIAPSTLKVALPPIKTPQYVDWIAQYYIKEE